MSSVRAASLLAAAWLAIAPLTVSAEVHAAVVFTRTGERTPLLGDMGTPDLTSLGATQAYNQGSLFRQRYVAPAANDVDLSGPDAIRNISAYGLLNSQIYVLASDYPYTAATAQAFLQGLYPPYTLNVTDTLGHGATAALANGTYIDAPLDGYQYPRIRTVSHLDPFSIFLAGQEECINYAFDRSSYFFTAEFNETQARTSDFYHEVGAATLSSVVPEPLYDYINAYAIFDYLNFQYVHDVGIQAILSNNITLRGGFDELRWLADQQQWAFNSMPNSDQWIRTVAGKTLARKVLGQLAVNIATEGASAKLSLLFGEFQPMLAFFSLALASRSNSSSSYGIPDFASSMVFELFSYGSSANSYPSTSDLWVRFYFRNGTSPSSKLVEHSLFGHGPSEAAMRWSEFEASMADVMLDGVEDWCTACGADSVFCPGFNASFGVMYGSSKHSRMAPAVAGVIGASIALGAALLAVAALMLLGGLRVRRADSVMGGAGTRRKSSLGGFKGSAKLASDADVSFASKGAPFGVSVMEQQPQKKHSHDQRTSGPGRPRERIGSWELGDTKKRPPSVREEESSRHTSMEIDEIEDGIIARPVAPHERI